MKGIAPEDVNVKASLPTRPGLSNSNPEIQKSSLRKDPKHHSVLLALGLFSVISTVAASRGGWGGRGGDSGTLFNHPNCG